MAYFILGLTLILILILMTSFILSNILLKPRRIKYETLFTREIETKRLDKKWYDNLDKREFTIKSRYGYDLSCSLLNSSESKKQLDNPKEKIKLAIICHGYTSCKYGSLLYAKLYIKRGISVLVYDHRNHGLSGKTFTSMGYYEKFDLQTVVDWCYDTFGQNLAIVTHGESMGGATVLSHLTIDGRVRAVVSDCSYDTLENLIKYQIKKFYHLPQFPFILIADIIIRMRAKFSIKDVNPISGVIHTNAPILFIHGLEDDYIPYSMSENMYNKKLYKREIYLAPNASHAQSGVKNSEEYEKVLNAYLDKYYFK